MKKYYVQIKNKRKGPFDINQLMELHIYPDTMVWNEELDDWKSASEIPELKPIIQYLKESNQLISKKSLKWLFLIIVILIVATLLTFIYSYNRNFDNSSDSPKELNETNIAKQPGEQDDAEDDELNRKKREEKQIEENKKNIRNNWSSYIKCRRSGYTVEGLGGISGLQVYFENKTEYFIESASAEIDIITANGYIYKTEYISITNLGGNNTYTYSVPYSPRGSKVSKPRITYIKSATLNFCYSPYGNDFVDSNDPYRCN